MLIQGQMGVRGVVHLFVVFFLLFTLVAANPGSNKDSEDYLLANLISSVEINRDMVLNFLIFSFELQSLSYAIKCSF